MAKCFLILSALLSVSVARPSVLQVNPLANLQARASASASSSLPQQLTLLRLLPNNVPLDPDSRAFEALEDNSEQEATGHRVQANLARDGSRNILSWSPLLSASSSASASSSLSDGRIFDSLEPSLNQPAQRDEQLRSSGHSAQSQSQQHVSGGPGSLLSATRLSQSLASLSPTGASSSSSVQVLESPELSAARAALQHQQAVLWPRDSSAGRLPLIIGNDGEIVTAPLILL
ncbi:uncharacterized protein LOC106647010 [Copidosoma floridanum]|uniref:uncharacterized protein LOC106647010 n=1 Tax=Copidosoma floridanum TaxID=29053 RepID=UPI0006C9B8D0|nr:uncharacterized protein LOC106647010 [Copidosoma floridanum]